MKSAEGDVLRNTVPPTETDLGSSPLHDECKQTIPGRISAVRRAADNVQPASVCVRQTTQSEGAGVWRGGGRDGGLSGRSLAPPTASLYLTVLCHPDISLWVKQSQNCTGHRI